MRYHPPSTIDHPRSARIIAALCVLSMWHAVSSAAGYELSHGRQVILNHGLQVQGMVFLPYLDRAGFSDYNRWASANFSTVNFWQFWESSIPGVLQQMPTGTAWNRLYYFDNPSSKYLSANEITYIDNFVGMQYCDERSDIMTSSRQADMLATYNEWRSLYPNAMAYTNSCSAFIDNAGDLENYMVNTHPDMLSFDYYPFFTFPTDQRNYWYNMMSFHREVALKGWDLTGTQPIAYGQFLNLYRTPPTAPLPSESYVRLQQFASWAFGYTSVTAYVYNGCTYGSGDSESTMFSAMGDDSPTVVFDYVKDTNRQSRNLGPALVRLVSTGIFMKPGSDQSVDDTGLTTWSARAGSSGGYTDYITAITPYTNSVPDGGRRDNTYNDILIGYFKPLLSDNSGCTFANGLHFMIVNGASQETAADAAQWYHARFDFTGSDFDSLVRLSRDTGKVELVMLTPDPSHGSSAYYLDLNLPGGTGDLFAFWNSSNPLPTIPEPGTVVLLGTGSFGLLAYALQKEIGLLAYALQKERRQRTSSVAATLRARNGTQE